MEKHVSRFVILVLALFPSVIIPASNADSDIEVVYMAVNSEYTIIPLDEDSKLGVLINLRNNKGSDDIPAGSTDILHVRAYMSADESSYDDALGDIHIANLTSGLDELLEPGITEGHTRAGLFDGDSITISSDTCQDLPYFCVEVLFANTTYIDGDDITNNFKCKQFGLPITDDNKIGIYKCYIDIEIADKEPYIAHNITYIDDVVETITFTINITNTGGIHLTEALVPEVYLTSSNVLTTESILVKQDTGSVYNSGVEADEIVVFPPFNVDIRIPLDSDICNAVTHICVEITSGSVAYEDNDLTNNYRCEEFGPVYGCPAKGIDLTMESFMVEDWEGTIYNIGVDNVISLNCTVSNGGDEAVTTGTDNYSFEVYLVDETSATLDCTVDKSTTTNLGEGLSYGNVLDIGEIGATCTLPADTAECEKYEQLCLKVILAAGTEAETTDNVLCQPFGDNVGNKSCPDLSIDLAPTITTLTSSSDPYPLGIDVETSINITLTNSGPGDLPTVADPSKNFLINVYLSKTDSSLSNSVDSISVDDSDVTFVDDSDVRQGIDKDGTIMISLSAPINIPDTSICEEYLFLCVEVSVDDNSIYTDTTNTNDFACAQLPDTECFIDIAVTSWNVTSPSDLEYKPGFESDVVIQLFVTNNGGLPVPVASSGHNFEIAAILTDDTELTFANRQILTVTNNLYSEEIAGKAYDIVVPDVTLKITIPSSKTLCDLYTKICVQLTDIQYTDDDTTNDFVCLEFGPVADNKAGVKSCSIDTDLSVTEFTLISSEPLYDFDVDIPVMLTFTVMNNGVGDLPAGNLESINYNISFYYTDNANLEDATKPVYIPTQLDDPKLAAELITGSDVMFNFDDVPLRIPLESCLSITHICVLVTLEQTDDVFTDPVTTNNDRCVMFEGEAGRIPCHIDIGIVGVDVINPGKYEPDIEYTRDIRLSVRNYGSVGLVHTPANEAYNFKPEVYLSSHADIDIPGSTVRKLEDAVDLTWDHEVGSRVTIVLDVFEIKITIPEDDCDMIKYLCFKIEHEGWYDDGNEKNDKMCVSFVGGEAGVIACEDEPSDTDDSFGLPITYTIIIIVIVVLAVLIGLTVAVCNGCKRRRHKGMV